MSNRTEEPWDPHFESIHQTLFSFPSFNQPDSPGVPASWSSMSFFLVSATGDALFSASRTAFHPGSAACLWRSLLFGCWSWATCWKLQLCLFFGTFCNIIFLIWHCCFTLLPLCPNSVATLTALTITVKPRVSSHFSVQLLFCENALLCKSICVQTGFCVKAPVCKRSSV